jgi:hypothetical protein
MVSEISSANKDRPKGRLFYEGLLKAMPQDLVKELARRRLEEIAEYEKRQKPEKNQRKKAP